MGRGRISLMDSGGLQTRFAAAGKERKEVMMRGEVALGFRLYAIRDVSHMTHSFHAVFRCFYDWVDPNLALKLRDGSIDEAEWTKDVPEVSFTNASALQAEPWTQAPRVLDATTGRLYIHRRYEATLTERLELHRFPFDAQQLTIYMQLSSSKFRQYSLRLLPIELRGVPSIPGWSLLIPEQFRTEAEKAASLKAKAVTTVKLRVRREAGFFVRSILFTEGLLTTLSVIAFTLNADGVWDRVELQLALIFAILALRFSCADAVPVVPYATILDAYQNSCIVMLVMLATVLAVINGAAMRYVVGSIGPTAEQERLFNKIDLYMGIGCCALWALFNVVFFNIRRDKSDSEPVLRMDKSELIEWTAPWTKEDLAPPWNWTPEDETDKRASSGVGGSSGGGGSGGGDCGSSGVGGSSGADGSSGGGGGSSGGGGHDAAAPPPQRKCRTCRSSLSTEAVAAVHQGTSDASAGCEGQSHVAAHHSRVGCSPRGLAPLVAPGLAPPVPEAPWMGVAPAPDDR